MAVMRTVTIILDAILAVLCGVLKIIYYASGLKDLSGGFYDLLWFGWMPVSILITLSPMLSQIVILAFMKFKKQLFAFLVPLFVWGGDIMFEIISMIGATMSLDDDWIDISVTMLKCLALFMIPLLLSLISFILSLKKKKDPQAV